MLPKKLLGSTGINISSLTLGTVKFGRNTNVKYPKKFDLPDIKTCGYLLDLAYDLGFNIIDTAPAYGLSEQIIGELLKTRKHQGWVICTKGGENYNTKTQLSNYDNLTTFGRTSDDSFSAVSKPTFVTKYSLESS